MLARSRMTIALVLLACLDLVILLHSQTDLYKLARLRKSFPHIFKAVGSWPTFNRHLHLPHLQRLCSETRWVPNLWLHCHSGCGPDKKSFCGGLNNARNRVQTCLRWAIDAGSGLILPSVTIRGEDLVNTNGQEQCLDSWWDLGTIQEAMAANCPQLQLRTACDGLNTTGAVPPLGELADAATVLRPAVRIYTQPPFANGTFRENVALPALQDAASLAGASPGFVTPEGTTVVSMPSSQDDAQQNTTIFEFGDAYIGWNYRNSDELDTIRKELHLAVPYRADLLEVGDTIARSPQLHGGAFIGVHLRGENDWPGVWGSADQQMSLYEAEMLKMREKSSGCMDISAVYVSSGNQQAIETFRDKLVLLNFTVHDKWTILQSDPDNLALMDMLDFDSRAIIDFQVLVKARFYIGVFMSTMSQYVAYTRTADDENDFFDKYIFADTSVVGFDVHFPEPFTIRGDNYTKLIVTDGAYLGDTFP